MLAVGWGCERGTGSDGTLLPPLAAAEASPGQTQAQLTSRFCVVGSHGSAALWLGSSPGSRGMMHPRGRVAFLLTKPGLSCRLIRAFGQQVWLPRNTEQLLTHAQ